MKFCSKCGKEVKEDAIFCESCGAQLLQESNAPESTTPVNTNVSGNKYLAKNGNIVIIFMIAASLLAVVGLALFLFADITLGAILLIVSLLIWAIPSECIRRSFLSSGGNKKDWRKYFKNLKKENTLAKLQGIISIILAITVILCGIAMIASNIYRESIPAGYADLYSEYNEGIIEEFVHISDIKEYAEACEELDEALNRAKEANEKYEAIYG